MRYNSCQNIDPNFIRADTKFYFHKFDKAYLVIGNFEFHNFVLHFYQILTTLFRFGYLWCLEVSPDHRPIIFISSVVITG